jgi:Zn-dependent protease with chaperone function
MQIMHILRPAAVVMASAICLGGFPGGAAIAGQPAKKKTPDKAVAYSKAKELLTPDLYVVYRITERIITANSIKRPIRIAVRRGIDSAGACEGVMGVSSESAKCQALELLPDIDKATNFELWAAQVVSTMRGSPNAAAYSNAGTITVNIPMLKELAGKPDQLACVIGHELAHVTQSHSEEAQKKQLEYDAIAADKIAKAAKNAHNSQRSGQIMLAILAGVSSGLSGNSSAINNASMQIALSNISAELAAQEVAQTALKFSPTVGEAINKMQGLNKDYIKRTWRDVNLYLRDSALSAAGFSRSQEYEADLLGLEYVTAAGFSPQECVKVWAETMPHDKDKLIARLLPKGVKDPALVPVLASTTPVQAPAKEQEKPCVGTPIDCRNANASKKEEETEQVSPEAMQALMSTHPDHASRAKAISQHLDQPKKNQLINKGKAALGTTTVRAWSYDQLSDSVLISDQMVDPASAANANLGTTGIDVDKTLGF